MADMPHGPAGMPAQVGEVQMRQSFFSRCASLMPPSALLFSSSRRKNALHGCKISFVTGKFVHLLLGLLEAKHGRPWLRPCSGIRNSDLVAKFVRSDTREAFTEVQAVSRSNEVVAGGKICGIHDERQLHWIG